MAAYYVEKSPNTCAWDQVVIKMSATVCPSSGVLGCILMYVVYLEQIYRVLVGRPFWPMRVPPNSFPRLRPKELLEGLVMVSKID